MKRLALILPLLAAAAIFGCAKRAAPAADEAVPIDLLVTDVDGAGIPNAYVQGSGLGDFEPSLHAWTGQDGHATLDGGDWNSALIRISKPGYYQAVGELGRIVEDETGCHTTVRLQTPTAPVEMVSEYRVNDIRITSEEKPFDLIRGKWHVADNPTSIADVFLRSECEVLSDGAVEKRLYFRFPDSSDGMYLYDYGAISGLSNEAGPNVVIGIDESAFTNSFVLIERHSSHRATSPCIPPTNISSEELGQHNAAVFKLRSSLDSGPIYALMADVCSIQTPWSMTSNVARFPKWLDYNPNPGVPSVEYSFAEQYLEAARKKYKEPPPASHADSAEDAKEPATNAAALPAWFDGICVGMSTNEFFALVPDAKEVRNPRTDSEPGMIAYSLETGNDPFGADWFFLFKNDGLVASFAESGLKEGSLSGVRDAIVAELAVRFGEPDEKVWVPFYALIDSPDAFRIAWTNETSILAVDLAEAIDRSDLTVLLAGRAFAMEDSEISTVLFGIVPDNLTADAIRHIRHFGADCVRTLIEKGEFERARSQALLLRGALIRAAEKAPDDDAEEFAKEARRLLALVTATNAPARHADSADGAKAPAP